MRKKKYFFYNSNGYAISRFNSGYYLMAAVSEKELPNKIFGPCVYKLPRLPSDLKKGTWFVPVIGDPIVLTEKVQYLGKEKLFFPDFIQKYIKRHEKAKDERGTRWMACQFADGKKLYLNWLFTADAKDLPK